MQMLCAWNVADMSLKVTGKELEKESVVHTLAQGVALILMHTYFIHLHVTCLLHLCSSPSPRTTCTMFIECVPIE